MPLLEQGRDFQDNYNTVINGIPIPIHLYYLNKELMNEPNNYKDLALAPFTQAGQTIQMIYTPFLDFNEIMCARMPFDYNFYGPLEASGSQRRCYVYKIVGLANHNTMGGYVKVIGKNFTVFKDKTQLGIPTDKSKRKRTWKDESKLQHAPYTYKAIQDFNASPLILAPHLFTHTQRLQNKFDVMVKTGINMNGGYIMYVPFYKNDTDGINEGSVADKGMDLPVSSSVFNDYMARNKSQMIANTKISAIHGGIDAVEGGFNAMLGVATAGAGAYRQEITSYDKIMSGALDNPRRGREAGWTWMNRRDIAMGDFINNPHINYGTHNASSGISNFAHGLTNMFASAYHLNAQMSDMFGSPRNVSMSSSDALFSISKSNKKVMLYTYGLTEYYKNKLSDFFTMYGYKQRKLMPLNRLSLKSRRYFVFIKTVDVNIKVIDPRKGSGMSKNELNSIKKIFNNGIRFWHFFGMSQDNVDMYDYSWNNYEV